MARVGPQRHRKQTKQNITSNHNVCAYNVYSQMYFNLDLLKATKLEFKKKSVSEICNSV